MKEQEVFGGGYLFEGVVPMEIGAQSIERRYLFVEVSKALELMLSFGSLLISLLTLMVLISKNNTKK